MSKDKRLPIVGSSSRDPLQRLLEGDSSGVIEDLKSRVEAAPYDDVAWLQLGTAYLHINHWYEAAEAFAKAVDIDGDDVAARRMLARALTKLRKLDEAVFQLVRAKRSAAADADVARELGVAFYDKQLFDKALRELTRARELAPTDARVPYAMGLAHEGKGSFAEAIAAYRDAVRIDPAFVDARRTLADALAAMGEMAQAVAELEHALRHDRRNTQVAMNLDVLRRGLRELNEARLLGKREDDVDRSMLVQQGQLKRKGKVAGAVRYGNDLAELWLTLDAGGCICRMMMLLPDPVAAAAMHDDVFGVTVVSADGRKLPANYATAVTVTFLREALGCPLTRASELYATLLKEQREVSWGGARLGFDEVALGEERRPGIYVMAQEPS